MENQHVVVAAVAVLVAQVVTGLAAFAAAERGAVARPGWLRLDAVDVAAVGLAAYAFWLLRGDALESHQARTAYLAVLLGTGVKEALRGWFVTEREAA